MTSTGLEMNIYKYKIYNKSISVLTWEEKKRTFIGMFGSHDEGIIKFDNSETDYFEVSKIMPDFPYCSCILVV